MPLADEISTFVNENLTSKFKSSIDTKALEIKLKSQYERISAVSVAIIGQTLVVNISEAMIKGSTSTSPARTMSPCFTLSVP